MALRRSQRRRLAAVLALLAAPLYALCAYHHVCGCGHMRHGPYASWHIVMDGAWVLGFALAAILALRSDRWIAWPLMGLLVALAISRLLLGLLWGLIPPMVELPVLVSVVLVAVICLVRKAKLPSAGQSANSSSTSNT